MRSLVTIAIPIYSRLEYLPHVLRIVAAQDYPAIELIVSDNGMNGTKVRQAVETYYPRPFRFRQNPASVELTTHFNQLLDDARGKYFFMLCDDDEISPNYISDLVDKLEVYPHAEVAFSRQEVVDLSGVVVKASTDKLPDLLSGPDFILATWGRYEFGFKSVSAFLTRTDRLRALGGYPSFTKGTHIDDAMVVMLCLGGDVALSPRSVWRNRLYESSNGMAIPISDLAAATRQFLEFLDTNATIGAFAAATPAEWARLKACLRRMAWQTYFERWKSMYRKRMSFFRWAGAAFAIPYIPAYYQRVRRTLLESPRSALGAWLRKDRGAQTG